MDNNRDFKGIWITKEIWLAKDLTLQEKVFLVEIESLDNNDGCFAGNLYFSEFFGISRTRVSLVIKSLIDKGYITSKIIYKEGTKQILKRVLKKSYTPPLIKVKDPVQEKLIDNNTSLIIQNNNTYNIDKKTFNYVICKKFLDYHLENKTPSCIYLYNKDGEEKILNDRINEIDKLKRLDKVPENFIKGIIDFIIDDDFWKNQILSINKLRKKDKLGTPYFIKMLDQLKKQQDLKPKKSKGIPTIG